MKCCPPGRGHNMVDGFQPCHLNCARGSVDREAVECMEIAWRRYRRLSWWRIAQRREALGTFRRWRDRALAAGRPPPPNNLFQVAPAAKRSLAGDVEAG